MTVLEGLQVSISEMQSFWHRDADALSVAGLVDFSEDRLVNTAQKSFSSQCKGTMLNSLL